MFGPTKGTTTRLGQWDGRRQSSRGDLPVLGRLLRWPVLARLSVVLSTATIISVLAWWAAPPLPYRVDEVYPYDLRARVDFDVINHVGLANPDAQERPGIVERYSRGMVLVARGEPIKEREL